MVCFQDLLTHGMICARKYRIFSINKSERRNTKMEISLDNMQVSFMTAGIKTASDSVSLTAAETEIKSRSEAMDKFQEEYRQLKAFVKDYRDTLNNDLAKIDLIINAINGNGNRLIRVNKDTNKDAVKEFLVTTLSQCDTNGHFIETPYSESKLLDKYLGEVVLNIYVTNLYPEPIGEYILDIQDDNFGNRPHLDMWYVKQQVDKYWNTIEYFINETNN